MWIPKEVDRVHSCRLLEAERDLFFPYFRKLISFLESRLTKHTHARTHPHFVPEAIVIQRQLHNRNLRNLLTFTPPLPAQISETLFPSIKGTKQFSQMGDSLPCPPILSRLDQRGKEGLRPGGRGQEVARSPLWILSSQLPGHIPLGRGVRPGRKQWLHGHTETPSLKAAVFPTLVGCYHSRGRSRGQLLWPRATRKCLIGTLGRPPGRVPAHLLPRAAGKSSSPRLQLVLSFPALLPVSAGWQNSSTIASAEGIFSSFSLRCCPQGWR